MTTSDADVLKPIIVSHDYKHCYTYTTMASIGDQSALENHTEHHVTKSSSSTSFKRVSFGNPKGAVVQTYTYERIPTVEEDFAGPSSSSHEALAQTFDSPSKVKVTAMQSEAPHSIPPPAAFGAAVDGMDATGDHHGQIISPPLPSLRKMEVENPFRPDGRLSHEVDPIVETYKHRPFPSDHRESIDGSLKVVSPISSPIKFVESPKNSVDHKIDIPPVTPPLEHLKRNSAQLDVQHKQLTSAKPGHLEIVHIEKKKKCACCSVQ